MIDIDVGNTKVAIYVPVALSFDMHFKYRNFLMWIPDKPEICFIAKNDFAEKNLTLV